MNQRQRFATTVAMTTSLVAGVLLLAGGAGAAEAKRAYKWVDRSGVTHYGDSIPPEYAAQGHEELNAQGVPVRETTRQLNPQEAAKAQQDAADQQRREQHDSFLTSTYTKVGDIEQLRDERVGLVAAQLELARGSLTAADQRLNSLTGRLNGFKPYSTTAAARRVPDQLAEELVRALSDRRAVQSTFDLRQQEMSTLRASFDADIARFRELTSRSGGR